MLSSILDDGVRHAIASEMLRVLRPGGAVLWYDIRVDNPDNPDVRRVARDEIEALFPGCRVALTRATLAPPLTRLLAPRARVVRAHPGRGALPSDPLPRRAPSAMKVPT